MNNLPGKWFPLVLLASILFWACVAGASAGTIYWTNPTTRTDGTALPVTEIGKYQVYLDNVLVVDNVPAASTSATLNIVNGTHTLTMRTIDTEGRAGPFSVALSVVVKSPPSAPGAIRYVP